MTINNKGSEDAGAVPATSTISVATGVVCRMVAHPRTGILLSATLSAYDGGELGSTGTE